MIIKSPALSKYAEKQERRPFNWCSFQNNSQQVLLKPNSYI